MWRKQDAPARLSLDFCSTLRKCDPALPSGTYHGHCTTPSFNHHRLARQIGLSLLPFKRRSSS